VPDVANHMIRDGDYDVVYVAANGAVYKYFPDANTVLTLKTMAAGEDALMIGYAGLDAGPPIDTTPVPAIVVSTVGQEKVYTLSYTPGACAADSGVIALPGGPVTARYWRVVELASVLAIGMDSMWGINLLEFRSAAGNQAKPSLGHTPSAQSNYIGRNPSMAFEENGATVGWLSSSHVGPSEIWVKSDLGSAKTITEFRLVQDGSRCVHAWKIQSSTDNVTWTDRYSSPAISGVGNAPAGWYGLAFNDAGWSASVARTATWSVEGGQAVWASQSDAANEQVLVRRRFALPAGTVSGATLIIRADSQIKAVYINGTPITVPSNAQGGDSVVTLTVDSTALRDVLITGGDNVLALQVANGPGGGEAGVAFRLETA
jgi:hypothetical protein